MRKIIAIPTFGILYIMLLLTSFVSRTMAVISVTLAAACANLALWSGSVALINKFMKEKQ